MLVAKIPSPNKMKQLKFQPGMFFNLQAGSLLVADCRLLENLWDATIRAVQDGSFKRTGLVLLVDAKTLDSSDRLTQVNLSLRSLWSSTTVLLKPWTSKTMYYFFQSLTFLKKKNYSWASGEVFNLSYWETPPPLFQDSAPPLAVVITPKYRTYTYHT